MKYHTATQRDTLLPNRITWMDFKDMILNKRLQTQRIVYSMMGRYEVPEWPKPICATAVRTMDLEMGAVDWEGVPGRFTGT